MSTQKVLVFTDTHVTNPDSNVKGRDTAASFRKTLEAAAADHADAACAVIMGDLVHWGGPGEYEAFRACLDDLPWPVHLMIGNHDNRVKFAEAFPDAPLTEAGHVQSAVDLDDWRLVLLDSHDETFSEPVHSGILDPARIEWMRQAMADALQRRIIVFVHHTPLRSFFDGMDNIGLRNADEFLGLVAAQPNAELVVSGHIHRSITAVEHGVPVTVFKSTAMQSPLALGDPSTDLVSDEGPGYGLLILHPGGVTVHNVDLD